MFSIHIIYDDSLPIAEYLLSNITLHLHCCYAGVSGKRTQGQGEI